jgi:hypothetical protein
MPSRMVRVAFVVYLEAKRVLQVIARLFRAQPGHDSCSFGNVYDLQLSSLRQYAGDLVYPFDSRYVVCALAQVELTQRADVAEFMNAVVPVVVRHPCAYDTAHEVLRNNEAESENALSTRRSSVSGTIFRRAVSP